MRGVHSSGAERAHGNKQRTSYERDDVFYVSWFSSRGLFELYRKCLPLVLSLDHVESRLREISAIHLLASLYAEIVNNAE